MEGTRFGELAWVGLIGAVLGAFAWLAGGSSPPRASGGPPQDDRMPASMVAFFPGGACPPGWQASADVQGRLLVGVVDGSKSGAVVGTPLADQEDRQHLHTFSGSVTLGPKGVFAANGGGSTGTQTGTYPVAGATEPATSGLPFVQMAACVKP